MVGGGQFSLHTPLSLKWRQACKEVELFKVHEKKQKKQNTKPNQTKPGQFLCYLPDSRSLWVRCIQQHTACGSSHWEESLCIAGSPTHSYYGSLWRKNTSPDFQLFFNQTEFPSASCENSQVWQSRAASPQQLVKHSEEQLGPAATGKAQ